MQPIFDCLKNLGYNNVPSIDDARRLRCPHCDGFMYLKLYLDGLDGLVGLECGRSDCLFGVNIGKVKVINNVVLDQISQGGVVYV